VIEETQKAADKLTAENKQVNEDLTRFKKAVDFDRILHEYICKEDYEGAVNYFLQFRDDLKPKEIPESLKPTVYRELLKAVSKGRVLTKLTENDLGQIEEYVRKDRSPCASSSFYTLGIVHAVNGNLPKARTMILSTLQVDAKDFTGKLTPEWVAKVYATFLLIDLASQDKQPAAERVKAAWSVLAELQKTFIIPSSLITAELGKDELQAFRNQMALRGGAGFADAAKELEENLKKRTFLPVPKYVRQVDGSLRPVGEPVEMDISKEKEFLKPPVVPEGTRIPGIPGTIPGPDTPKKKDSGPDC
jgi:hypothetical protein